MPSWTYKFGASPLNQILTPGEYELSYKKDGSAVRRDYRLNSHITLRGTRIKNQLYWTPDLTARHVDEGTRHFPLYLVTRMDSPERLQPVRFVVIHLHANAVDIGDQAADEAVRQADTWEVHVVVPEYPGYGQAPGEATETTINRAAQSSVKFAMQKLGVPANRIIVFGRSIGTGVAASLAAWMSQQPDVGPPAALMLFSPFVSIRALALDFVGCIGKVILNRWDTKKHLRRLEAPVLILHGNMDEVIPYEHAMELHNVGLEPRESGKRYPCELHMQRGKSHNIYEYNDDVIVPGWSFLDRNVDPRRHQYLDVTPPDPKWMEVPADVRRLPTPGTRQRNFMESNVLPCLSIVGEVCVCGIWKYLFRTMRGKNDEHWRRPSRPTSVSKSHVS